MEQINILFFALTSFFAFEGIDFASEKTTVIVSPNQQDIQIIQDHLFTIVQSKNDSLTAAQQWNKLLNWDQSEIIWSKELDHFTNKNIDFNSKNKNTQTHITLNYSDNNFLKVLGIWYNSDTNEFSINHIPQYNLKTKDGILENNYWHFKGHKTFRFTLEPFFNMPEKYQQFKKPLNDLLLKK